MPEISRENIILLNSIIQGARLALVERAFIEIHPPILVQGLANPIVPGLHCVASGVVFHLQKDASYSLFASLKYFEAVYSITPSFRDQANGINRLLEFHYLQGVQAASLERLQTLTLELVDVALRRTREVVGLAGC